MRQALAPLLFDEDDPIAAESLRRSVVAPAQRSDSAVLKAQTKQTVDGLPVHSFQSLLALPGDRGQKSGSAQVDAGDYL